MYKWYQVLVQDLGENMDENLAQLTQKDWRFENVTATELNCKVVKKGQPSHFNPPSPARWFHFWKGGSDYVWCMVLKIWSTTDIIFWQFVTIFCPFTHITIWKIKILKKRKKNAWQHHHFIIVHHKWQLHDVLFPR